MKLWRNALRPVAKGLAYRLQSRFLYRLCNFYVNAVDNDHDCALSTNGEAVLAGTRLPASSVVFDVGAAIGEWTAMALQVNPSLEVHCFEPTSRRFATLSERFGDRVVLNKLALGRDPGQSRVYWGASGGSNSLFPQRYAGEAYAAEDVEQVPVSTLDLYCANRGIPHVDFVKMDIEGCELAAIQGATRMLREGRIAALQFEYSYVYLDAGASLKSLMEYVTDVAPHYDFYKIFPDGLRHVGAYRHGLDNFKTQNWVLLRRPGFAAATTAAAHRERVVVSAV